MEKEWVKSLHMMIYVYTQWLWHDKERDKNGGGALKRWRDEQKKSTFKKLTLICESNMKVFMCVCVCTWMYLRSQK